MAAAGSGDGPSAKEDLIDLYGDLNENEDMVRIAEANELFDAVLTGSVNQDKKNATGVPPCKETPAEEGSRSTKMATKKVVNSQRRLSLYIGNFPWWTSDKDLVSIAQRLGVKDLTEIKFAENKINGQSRGYAEVVVTTEESLKILLEKLPQCELNGERIDCRFATRQNLTVFEDIANKRIPLRVNAKDTKESSNTSEKIPSLLPQEPSPPPLPPLFPSHPLANRFPSLPNPFLGHPPPPFPHMPPTIPPPMPPHLIPPPLLHIPSQPSPSLHINPAFFPPAQDAQSSKAYNQQSTPQSTAGDFEELMNRNRAITSSAITKAVSGATSGDMGVAMETLLTAIAIIKQSRVYGDERCQALVTSLKDCLVSIQNNFGYRKSSRSRERERERDRDRGRDRERERDRDRERDREREDLSGWEGAGMSRRHRERSLGGERDKDRSRERERERERERHRDYRDRYR
ncbi:cleavage and polyadenylation specificity factor subunit 7-like [Mugil cephalus]|uniref:cleavage and polyadenylation specificity factor subunit 7-like n=1 Tax=Mugil cephalus TaxID=48193 RepID=UPI001FB65191|nr:cleavage and polyadenylation specificity factor subunit 7-like [Mugil cephalus]